MIHRSGLAALAGSEPAGCPACGRKRDHPWWTVGDDSYGCAGSEPPCPYPTASPTAGGLCEYDCDACREAAEMVAATPTASPICDCKVALDPNAHSSWCSIHAATPTASPTATGEREP